MNSDSPVICLSGRTSTPGAFMSTITYVRPAWRSESGSLRPTRMQKSAMCAKRRPDLLAVQHEVVALVVDPRAYRGEVGACAGLREALAPDLLRRQDLREVALLLLLRAVGHDRRPGHPEADHAHVARRLRTGELLEHDRLMAVRSALAPVLLGPGQPGVARVVELPRPLARVARGQIRLEPGANAFAERSLVGCVAEVDGAIRPSLRPPV